MIGANIYSSRRVNFDICYYWKANPDKTSSELVEETKPYGKFRSNESNAKTSQKNDVNNMFLLDGSTILLETYDKVEINAGDVVQYDGSIWIVVNIQERKIGKNGQFMKSESKKTFIQMRK